MAKKISGRFDPWRSDPQPEVEENPSRKTLPEPFDLDAPPGPQHCVQFSGLRAGIYVWMEAGLDDLAASARARKVLIDLVCRLNAREDVAKVFQGWGITPGVSKSPDVTYLREGDALVSIRVSPPDDPRSVQKSIDNLSLALRELGQLFPNVRDILSAVNVNPYVK